MSNVLNIIVRNSRPGFFPERALKTNTRPRDRCYRGYLLTYMKRPLRCEKAYCVFGFGVKKKSQSL